MKITEHLRELRKRLLLSVLGVIIAAIGGWFLVDPVLLWMQSPLTDITGARPQLNFQTIGAAFDLRLQVSLWLGVLMSSPWWIFQIGAFIAPGLKRKEKAYITIFGLVGIVLFAGGAVSGMWVVPKAVEIFNSFTPDGALMLLRADSYVTFFMSIVMAFGFSCLAPEILVALNFFGVLKARTMLKGWRWAIVVAAVFSAIANPLPSAWPMILQMGVLTLLYFIAVGISAINDYIKAHGRWSWSALAFWKKKDEAGAATAVAGSDTDADGTPAQSIAKSGEESAGE